MASSISEARVLYHSHIIPWPTKYSPGDDGCKLSWPRFSIRQQSERKRPPPTKSEYSPARPTLLVSRVLNVVGVTTPPPHLVLLHASGSSGQQPYSYRLYVSMASQPNQGSTRRPFGWMLPTKCPAYFMCHSLWPLFEVSNESKAQLQDFFLAYYQNLLLRRNSRAHVRYQVRRTPELVRQWFRMDPLGASGGARRSAPIPQQERPRRRRPARSVTELCCVSCAAARALGRSGGSARVGRRGVRRVAGAAIALRV
ncbi:hypothetical protein EVAR_97456_1 [Eumeta japonica]|uniref:Uncharacterized protein n=1 Tax=Eumeta variegata TaxID=151549 RepID=A0A4C1X154_EUMVA|nr:hypothetical protein EVAR_97456_1 [Eumeta japonica]